MNNRNKMNGMTSTVAWLIAGFVALCLMGIGWVYLVQYGLSIVMADPYPVSKVPTRVITSIPVTPTAEELTPTPTAAVLIAASTPPAGWVQFRTQGASLWLPASFVGGDLVRNKQTTISKINGLGRFYRNAVIAIQNTNSESVLWMVDKTPKQTDIITTVTVRHIVSTEETTLDQYIQDFLGGDVQGTPVSMLLTVNETKRATLLGRDARRLTYSTYYANHSTTGLLYYIKDGADIWAVNYGLGPKEYVDMLPIVEQSIQTFDLVK